MRLLNLSLLAAKHIARNKTRSLLTMVGVASGMFLFETIETMQEALGRATETSAKDNTLVVYRENRFCPSTSRLPEHYGKDIRSIEGVAEVVPIQIVVNNCGTSLDVVVFRGIPKADSGFISKSAKFEEGSIENWMANDDGALVGSNLAKRRNLKTGDRFNAAGITVTVSGIIQSSESSQNDNVAFVGLPFLQQASRLGLGVVTQFNVKVRNSTLLDSVAKEIDLRFKSDAEPTTTKPEKAFFASTAKELIELVRFSRWIGIASVLAVIGLIANTILLTVRGKISEFAVLQTIGFSRWSIGWLILSEGVILALFGGIMGIGTAATFLHFQNLTIGNEGLAIAFVPNLTVTATGVGLSLLVGVLAGSYPAWRAGKNSISESLKTT